MKIDLEKLDIDPMQFACFVMGLFLGYLCIVLAIDLQIYYVQSRLVTARLYSMIQDAEKGRPVSLPHPDGDSYPTS
jgi:hypothetical protein